MCLSVVCCMPDHPMPHVRSRAKSDFVSPFSCGCMICRPGQCQSLTQRCPLMRCLSIPCGMLPCLMESDVFFLICMVMSFFYIWQALEYTACSSSQLGQWSRLSQVSEACSWLRHLAQVSHLLQLYEPWLNLTLEAPTWIWDLWSDFCFRVPRFQGV